MDLQQRAVKGKVVISREERENLRQQHDTRRSLREQKIEHNFELIYPSESFKAEKYG